MSPLEIIMLIVKMGLGIIPLALIPVMIFLERKGAALIQDRIGPNRSELPLPGGFKMRAFGFVHNFTDVVKLFMKEDFIPKQAHKAYYVLAPIIPVATVLLMPLVIPWWAPFAVYVSEEATSIITGQILNTNTGLLLLFAMGALNVYGVVLGSWASNSKYSLLGGMRASAMMISYEVSMGLSVLGMFLIVGSFSLTDIVEWQSANAWGVIVQPVGFLLFMTSMFAETGRTPFDVIEGESEIVGGFHTEYSSIKFALFFMGEYAHIVIASLLMATIYFGGYHLPIVNTDFIHNNLGLVVLVGGILKAAVLFLLAARVKRWKAIYAQRGASDLAIRNKEYSAIIAILSLAGIGALAFGLGVGGWLLGNEMFAVDATVFPTGRSRLLPP